MGRLTFLKNELQSLYRRRPTIRASSFSDATELQQSESAQQRPWTSGNNPPSVIPSSTQEPLLDEKVQDGSKGFAQGEAGSRTETLAGEQEEIHDVTDDRPPSVPLSPSDLPADASGENGYKQTPFIEANSEEFEEPEVMTADPEPLGFEEAQAIRNEEYITFSGEGPECYTEGPQRFVVASDGVKSCVALLMTLDFSTRIQKTIRKQREYTTAREIATGKRWELTKLEKKVQNAQSSCRNRLTRLEEQQHGEDQDAKAELEQRLTVLEAMLLDVQGRKQEVIASIETKADILREVQASAIAYLEEALVCGQLVEPVAEEAEPEVQKLDLEEEYLLFCDKLKAAGDPLLEDEEIAPLDHNLDHLKAEPLSEEDQKKQDIVNDLWAAKQTLTQARNAFENRSNQRAQEFYANQAAADAGLPTTDDSPEAFDIRWVQETAGLTRALIDAEGAWTSAKRRAVDAGVPVEFDQDDQDTVFAGVDESDCGGDRMSAEQEMVPTVSSPTMRKWLSAVPEGVEAGIADDEAEAEADDWEADEVGISDSVSLVAEGRERARIDRWRRACMGEREA